MKTLADFPDLLRAHLVHPETPASPVGPTTEVFAPCCGRRTPADTVVDVRGVPGTVVAGGGHRAPKDHDWLCDGCRHRLVADPRNAWSESVLFSACRAHPDVVRRIRARELAAEAARRDFAAGRAHAPDEAMRVALEQLPPGVDPHRPDRRAR